MNKTVHPLSFIITKFLLLGAIVLCASCAVHHDLYREQTRNINIDTSQNYVSFFQLGNAGAYARGANESLLNNASKYIKKHSKKEDYFLFTGDNLHRNDLKDTRSKKQLLQQLEITKNFKGTALFLPGELEWNETGLKGMEEIEDAIEDFYDEEDHFMPKNGCPLETIEVNDEVELILINSQWYIEDWSKVKEMNDKCELKTREQFTTLLSSEIRKARHKTIIIGMHHPLYANGVYGGEIPAEVTYRPTAENLFIPGVGTLWSFLRSQGGLSKQDRYNPLMNELMSHIELASFDAPRVIILSSHERSMQYIDQGEIKQVIAGTGSSVKPARLSKKGLFTSTKPGFSEVRLYEGGASSVHFYGLQDGSLTELYSKTAFQKPQDYNIDSLPTRFPKTMVASIYPQESVLKSAKYEKFWGKHYRYVYGVPVEAPVALLDTLYGGLTVQRAGGGNQTNGLRLEDKEGREYNMRAIAKDPLAFLKSAGYNDLDAENYFEDTVPATVIEDFYTAAHPYGAFAIPRLAGAIDVPHTHPKLYYIPKQKALGNFNKDHGNVLYMIVEKPSGDFNKSHMFEFSNEVESTPDLFKELREDESNQLNERMYIRARIFDMLIGDWDRHEDQWRWAQDKVDEADGVIKYLAVPRDRDQVFAKFDGAFLEKAQKIMSGMRQFGNYGPDIPFIEQFSESAVNLDRAILQQADLSLWLEEVTYIQERITEEVVQSAFKAAPKEVQDATWMEIQESLLSRKRNLPDIVQRYYSHLSKFVSLKGTDKDDHFVIENLANGNVRVMAYRIKDGEKGTLLFDQTLDKDVTENIWIYGLDDKDIFEVNGSLISPIKIVLVGGLENDTFTVNGGKNVTIYDQKSYKNTIVDKGKATRHIDDIYENHIYDTERRPDSGGTFGLEANYNPDEGFSPHITFGKSTLGYERHPFTTKIELDARYISLTQAVDASLEWHKAHLFHDWNFKAFGRLTSANYTENFFGLGNGSFNNANSFDDNGVYTQYLQAGLGLYYTGEYGSSTAFDLTYENTNLRDINVITPALASTEYISLTGKYEYKSRDDEAFTTRGMHFTIRGSVADELTSSQYVGAIDPSITFWNAIDRSRNIVLKTSIASELRFGEDIPFYRLATLGANNGLRSYRQGRFRGEQSLAGSVDIGFKLKPIRTFLFPVRTQGYIGYDTGRVWTGGNEDSTLHYSYGGGLEFTTAAVLKTDVHYFYGPEGGRLGFGISLGL
ncbi:metallophosphoesterase [Dokdonia sp. LLG6352-1]|uniref:metallophosphoesterase n=1 Tax=Dokdonia sp. LLG6352-1 TaxID=3160831 RepID=UPI0038704A0B